MIKRKKGQSAVGAAVLVAIIAVLVVLYVLFLPPSERQNLFEEQGQTSAAVSNESTTLLSEFPGRLDYIAQTEIEHTIPEVNLNVFTESKILKEINNMYIKKSLFGEVKKNISFELDNPQDVEELMLNFVVKNADGRLTIKINNYEIYNKQIDSANIIPIKIRQHLQKENSLEFSVSSPGFAFWDTNEYDLENILLTANTINRESQEATVKFIMPDTEKNNLDKATLKIFPECNIKEVGKLEIFINEYSLYSAIPDCGLPMPALEFPSNYLNAGENIIRFKTDKGKYLIYQVKIMSYLRELEYPVYYFELSQEDYDDIQDKDKKIELSLRFADAVDYKNGNVIINGHRESIDQQGISWEKDISEWAVKGNNAIKIEPRKTLDIAELKATLED